MARREELLGVVALILGSVTQAARAAGPAKAPKIECYGINKAKGDNGCGVGQQQINLANKVFANKFAKAAPNDCANLIAGSAAEGYLGWNPKVSEDECFKEGGFVFAKNDKGVLTIKDRTGVKM